MAVMIQDGVTRLEEGRILTDHLLDRYLPSAAEEPAILHEAMRYSVMAGGKRLRPILAWSIRYSAIPLRMVTIRIK